MNIEKLIKRMTLEEKIGQLLQCGTSIYKEHEEIKWDMVRAGKIGAFLYIRDAETANKLQHIAVEESRLGIPLIFGDDIIHGLYTVFPLPAAEACSWEPELARRTAEVSARESRACGIHWTFAPMVDVARDARWGRNIEGAGEDPYLAAKFAASRVNGFQGNDISTDNHIAACAKHFAGYSACVGGRDYNSVEMSTQTLFDIHLPPFKSAIDAGVATVMSAFHDLNGIPCTGNKWLLTNVLREKMGFKGMVVSDAGAVEQLQTHGFTENECDTAYRAMDAGVDMEMSSFTFSNCMKSLVENGKISEERLDDAVRHVLTLKKNLGLFEKPYVDIKKASKVCANSESISLARECARKSIVLLKNNNEILPLDKSKKIALIGELAGSEKDMNGAWSGRTKTATTIYAALNENGHNISYAQGYSLENNEVYAKEALQAANNSDIIVFVGGENAKMSGEAKNRSNISIPNVQINLLRELKKTSKPIIAYIFSGRPLALRDVDILVDAMLWSGNLGTETGNAIMDIMYGDYNPSAKLVWTFPTSDGQSPYYYNHNNTGKPPIEEIWYSSKYIDAPIGVQYPFGYGLSYSEFCYKDFKISNSKLSLDDTLNAEVTVENVGKYYAEEVVQLYIRDIVGTMVRPVKELKGFQKTGFAPGEQKKIKFEIPVRQLGFHNQNMKYVVEPGEFRLYVGTNSENLLETTFYVI